MECQCTIVQHFFLLYKGIFIFTRKYAALPSFYVQVHDACI